MNLGDEMAIDSGGLQGYVSDLAVATKAGKVNWKEVNPTTFVWETGPPRNARVSIQRVDRTVQVSVPTPPGIVIGRSVRVASQSQTSYLFQAFEAMNANPVLSVD